MGAAGHLRGDATVGVERRAGSVAVAGVWEQRLWLWGGWGLVATQLKALTVELAVV